MIKIKKPKLNKVVTTEMTLEGEIFEIDLMPLPEEERLKMFRPFLKRKNVQNPFSKQMEITTYMDYNDEAFANVADNLLDHVVINFRGIADEKGSPLDGSLRENKILLGSIKVNDIEEITLVDENGQSATMHQPRERFFRTLIIDKAVELAQAIAEVERKNL